MNSIILVYAIGGIVTALVVICVLSYLFCDCAACTAQDHPRPPQDVQGPTQGIAYADHDRQEAVEQAAVQRYLVSTVSRREN